jgi:peptidoglycan hydrolase-like protein with peptidoglycan-binding domain
MPWLKEVPRSKAGPHSAEIKELQRMLREAGFDAGPSDGWFGPKTAAAVRRFQQSRKLTTDAEVGPQTWGAFGMQGLPRNASAPAGPIDVPATSPGGPKSGLPMPPAPGAPAPAGPEINPDAPLPDGAPHDRRESWFLSQQPGPYNPAEDAPGNGNCGPSAVTMIARAFGKVNVDAQGVDAAVEETRRRIGEGMSEYKGTSIAGLVKAAESYGLDAHTMGGVTTIEQIQNELAQGRLVIGHVKATYLRPNPTSGHYTVITKIENGRVYLNDSSNKGGPMDISVADFWKAVKARGSYTMISVGA